MIARVERNDVLGWTKSKDKPTNFIKVFDGFIFIGKSDDGSAVVGAQHRPICALHNRLIRGLYSLRYTRGPGNV